MSQMDQLAEQLARDEQTLTSRVFVPRFLEKVAKHFPIQTEEDADALLNIGFRLLQADAAEQARSQTTQSSFFKQAQDLLEKNMKKRYPEMDISAQADLEKTARDLSDDVELQEASARYLDNWHNLQS